LSVVKLAFRANHNRYGRSISDITRKSTNPSQLVFAAHLAQKFPQGADTSFRIVNVDLMPAPLDDGDSRSRNRIANRYLLGKRRKRTASGRQHQRWDLDLGQKRRDIDAGDQSAKPLHHVRGRLRPFAYNPIDMGAVGAGEAAAAFHQCLDPSTRPKFAERRFPIPITDRE